MPEPMFKISGKTHIGAVREQNEDALWFDQIRCAAIVADGVGGHNAGEVASNMTIKTFAKDVADSLGNHSEAAETKTMMMESFSNAHKFVRDAAAADSGRSGMGTTAVAFCLKSVGYIVANVGDSRAYLVKPGVLHQITADHTYVQDLVASGEISKAVARRHPERNILNRCIGTKDDIEIDFFEGELEDSERLLLCSDGLHNMLSEREILAISSSNQAGDDICSELVARSIAAGGNDNVSVVIAIPV
jgi:serine/threonine protein phosphatase PrpC